MMSRLFDKWLVIGLGVVVALLVVSAGVVYRDTRQLHSDAYRLAHTYDVLDSVGDLLSTITEAETGQRGFLITGDERYLEPYEDAVAAVDGKIDRLKRLTQDNQRQQARIPRLQELIRAKLDELRSTIALRKGPGFAPAQREVVTHLGKNRMDAIRAHIAVMQADERRLLRERQEANDRSYLISLFSGMLASLLALAAVGGFVWILRRHLEHRHKAAAHLHEQREWLRTTLTSIGDGVIATDARGRVMFLNAVAANLTGWSEEEAKGERLEKVFRIENQETRKSVENPALRALEEGTIFGLANHTILISRDGSERAIDDSAAPIRDENGHLTGVVLVFRDVTERRKTQSSARSLAAIVESSDDAIIGKDANGIITSWNQSAERIFGYTAAEAVGCSIAMLAPPDRADEMPGILKRIRQGERVEHFDTVRRAKDGQLVSISLTVSPIRDEHGEIVGASKIARDISERKLALQALQRSEQRFAAELDAMSRLHAVSTRLLSTTNLSAAMELVLENAITMSEADLGNIQLYSPQLEALEIVAQRGFSQDFLDYFRNVRVNEGSACASAMRSGTRIIIEDVELDPGYEPHRHAAAQAGYRAVQSTPIKSRSGNVLGMLSTHFRTPRRPSERDERLLDLYARHAADLIERIRFEEAIQQQTAEMNALFETLPVGIHIAHDPQCCRITANEAAHKLLRIPLGQNVSRLATAGEQPTNCRVYRNGIEVATNQLPVQRAARGEQVRNEDVEFRFDDGTILYVVTSAAPLYDNEGRVRGAVAGVLDVTSRRQAEERLRTHNERLRLLWEAASVLLTTTEPDSMLRELFARIGPHLGLDGYFNYMVNETGDGLTLVSSIGIPDEVVKQSNRLEFGQAISGAVALQRQPIVATHIKQSDDPKAQLVKSLGIRACACNPLEINNDLLGTLAFVGRSRDEFEEDELEFLRTICQYVAVAYERLRFVRQLRDADRRKDEFLATLAHELRNPLAPIRNAVELLRRSDGSTQLVEEATGMMGRQLDQMVRIVDDLLDLSRISQGKVQVRKERIELATVLRSAVEAVRLMIDARAQELTVTMPSETIYLEADATRLGQVISNLLDNAAKYTPKGGHIKLTAERQGGEAVVSVRDTGIGIAPEQLAHIFEMFSQVAPALERSEEGLGIGLSLVRGLVELHGGKVKAQSAGLGKGSEFIVRLPVAEIPPAACTDASDDGGRPYSGLKRRILVVDDNRDAANSMAIMLNMMGHETRTAYDGVEAIQISAAYHPSVILLDIGLPKMSGYEAARHIRQQPWGKGMALIALTGWGQEADARRALEAGFDHHLTKPAELAALEKLLARIGALP
jgi:PAS domain S-box-containing protein